MEHLAFDLFTRADLAYLREAVTCGLPSTPRPPTLGDDISWGELRALLAAPPAEVAALLNVPVVPRRAAPASADPAMSLVERYESYAGEVWGSIQALVAVLIAAIAIEDAAEKRSRGGLG